MQDSVAAPQKIKHGISMQSSNPTSGYTLKSSESRDSHRCSARPYSQRTEGGNLSTRGGAGGEAQRGLSGPPVTSSPKRECHLTPAATRAQPDTAAQSTGHQTRGDKRSRTPRAGGAQRSQARRDGQHSGGCRGGAREGEQGLPVRWGRSSVWEAKTSGAGRGVGQAVQHCGRARATGPHTYKWLAF